MRYGTVCSGIEAPSVAWEPLGWEPMWFSEIEKFPKAVLAHHYPNVPDLGDMTEVNWSGAADVDVLIGGTPCQSFSVAGLRKGLADPRGNLALEFLRIVDVKRPRWVIWENVPGVLSSSGGRDFGAFVGALAELRYGFCWRVLDAQYFGVPQRRRRVFLVGHIGGWTRPAAVLLERESLSGNPPPSREAREDASGSTGDGVARCITTGEAKRQDWETCNLVASKGSHWDGGPHQSLNQSHNTGGIGASNQEVFSQRGGGLVADVAPMAFHPRQDPISGDVCMPSETNGPMAVAFDPGQSGKDKACFQDSINHAPPIMTHGRHSVATSACVRRLTPIECERLQGFPDNYTRIPWRNKSPEDCPDGPRYKALGNSMAVPVVRWIGERIMQVEAIS